MREAHTLTVTIFSSDFLNECLESYESRGLIHEIEGDLLDGEDWWLKYADDAEYKFGNKWSRILVKTKDESQGRYIDRNYFLDGIINNNNFVHHDKLFLVGESSSNNLSVYFSEHIIFNYHLNKISSLKPYKKGEDETLISLIEAFTNVIFREAKIVDVVYNPSPQSIMMMKLSEHYKFMVHIPSKEKVNELIGLKKALNFTESIYHELLQARKIANSYGTCELNFMMPLIDEIERKIYIESDNSFYKTFLENFCL